MDLEFTEGVRIQPRLASPCMVAEQDRVEAILEDPLILISQPEDELVRDILPCSSRSSSGASRC